jgi:hypothetical protein
LYLKLLGCVCSPVQSGRPDHSSRHFLYAIKLIPAGAYRQL